MICLMEERIRDLEERVSQLENEIFATRYAQKNDAIERKRDQLRACYGDVITKTNAAKALGVTRATIYRMIRDGRLKIRSIDGKIDSFVLAKFMIELIKGE